MTSVVVSLGSKHSGYSPEHEVARTGGWGRAAAAANIRRSNCSSAQGKRDKYRYEVECVTDVPIGCILNR
jgi:hypothetical protein